MTSGSRGEQPTAGASTAEVRHLERHRRLMLAAVTSALARVIGLVANLVTVPITFEYLGAERFGLWMAISSLNLLMAFSDLGIGNGLMTAVATASGRDDRTAIREYVSSALVALTLLAVALAALFLVVANSIPWGAVLKLEAVSADEARSGITAFVVCFCVRIPAETVVRVQMGLQLGHRANGWQMFAGVAALVGVLAVAGRHGGVYALVLASMGIPTAVILLNAIWFFVFAERDLRPSRSHVRLSRAVDVIRTGGLFFALQCAGTLGFASDSLILATSLGPEAVAQYAIPAKLFDVVTMIGGMLVGPLWPAYAEARARGDNGWIESMLRKSMWLTAVGSACASVILLVAGREIVALWIGTSTGITVALLSWFALWTTARSLGATFSMFLNGVGIVRAQVIIAAVWAVVSLGAKIWATQIAGVLGLLAASCISYLVLVAIPYGALTRRFIGSIARS